MTEQSQSNGSASMEGCPTIEERQSLLNLVSSSGEKLLRALNLHSQHPQPTLSAAGAWSPAQIAEHVMLTDAALLNAAKKALALPVREDWQAATLGKGDLLRSVATVTTKVQASASLTPTANLDLTATIARYKQHLQELRKFFEEQTAPMHAHLLPHSFFGELSAYQWGQFLGYHTLRHVGQMERP